MATPSPNPTGTRTRPTFSAHPTPLNPSQISTTFQSYSSSISSLTAPSPATSAPLPSPSVSQNAQTFFSPASQQQQQQTRPPQSSFGFDYTPNRQGAGATAAETANYLNQAALLAEAAKRAQMAVVMRDLDGMEL